MSNFIEIPIIVIDSGDDDVDYQGLGIKEPEPDKEVIMAIINLDNIGRINAVEGEEMYNTVLFYKDEENQPIMRSPLTYDEMKEKVMDKALY